MEMRPNIEREIIMNIKCKSKKLPSKKRYFHSNIALLDEDFDLFSPEVIDLIISNEKGLTNAPTSGNLFHR